MTSHNPFLKTLFAALPLGMILGVAAVYAAGTWINPTANPPVQQIGAPITSSGQGNGFGQIKRGGIEVNSDGVNQKGLIVSGNGIGEGIFNISSSEITSRLEQLQVDGNLRISGLIMPDGTTGTPDQQITRSATGMNWTGREWMTIMGDFSHDSGCTGASPLLCQAFGYQNYALYCLSDITVQSSVWVRICKK